MHVGAFLEPGVTTIPLKIQMKFHIEIRPLVFLDGARTEALVFLDGA